MILYKECDEFGSIERSGVERILGVPDPSRKKQNVHDISEDGIDNTIISG